MSLRRGDNAKAAPKHQNQFAFKHNKHSRKTESIKAMPIAGTYRYPIGKANVYYADINMTTLHVFPKKKNTWI